MGHVRFVFYRSREVLDHLSLAIDHLNYKIDHEKTLSQLKFLKHINKKKFNNNNNRLYNRYDELTIVFLTTSHWSTFWISWIQSRVFMFSITSIYSKNSLGKITLALSRPPKLDARPLSGTIKAYFGGFFQWKLN